MRSVIHYSNFIKKIMKILYHNLFCMYTIDEISELFKIKCGNIIHNQNYIFIIEFNSVQLIFGILTKLWNVYLYVNPKSYIKHYTCITDGSIYNSFIY